MSYCSRPVTPVLPLGGWAVSTAAFRGGSIATATREWRVKPTLQEPTFWRREPALCLRPALAVLLLLFSFAVDTAQADAPARITFDGRLKRDPCFTGRKNELVYVELVSPVQLRLMRMNLSGGGAEGSAKAEPLHAEVTASEFEPACSPDGRFYAFVQNRGNLSLALVIRDSMTGKDAVVPPAGGFSGMRSPAISPDAGRVLYSFADEGRQQICSVDIQARDRQVLTDSRGVNNWPSFSPDGGRIAFGSTRDGNFEIYTMASDGSDVRRLSDHPTQDIRPRFSPDGRRIVFTSNRDENYELYVMDVDGSHLIRITEHPERDDYAAWHPDGKRIVAVCERDGAHDLYLLELPE